MKNLLILLLIFCPVLLFISCGEDSGTDPEDDTKNTFFKKFSGEEYDFGRGVEQTSDGGFIIAAETESYGNGSEYIWIIKTDESGDVAWEKYIGNNYSNHVQSIAISGSDYIISGCTGYLGESGDGLLVMKIDSTGNEIWTSTFGNMNCRGYGIIATSDGGVAVSGSMPLSMGSGASVLKLDSNGNLEWNYAWGTGFGRCVQQTADGGFILTGYIGDSSEGEDILLVKLDSEGNEVWNNTFSIGEYQYGYYVLELPDGGFVIGGYVEEQPSSSSGDALLIITDSGGNEVWHKTFDYIGHNICTSMELTSNNELIITGVKDSQLWLALLDLDGTVIWDRTHLDRSFGNSVHETDDNGFVVCGNIVSDSTSFDVLLIKTNSAGEIE